MLLSHVHFDHLDLPSLGRVSRDLKVVVPRGAAGLVRRRGFRDVVELEPGDELQVRGVSVRATPADHAADRGPLGVKAPALGYVLAGTRTLYFAGDTGLFPEMAVIADYLDVALLPVAGWGARLPAGHLDPPRGQALQLLRPRIAVPIHWGTYRRFYARESAAGAPPAGVEFARLARTIAPQVEVRVLEIGGSCVL